MLARNDMFKTRSLDAPAAIALAMAVVVATWLAQALGDVPAWKFDSAVRLSSGFAVLTGSGWALFQLALRHAMPDERRRWTLAFAAMVVLGLVETTDWLVGRGFMTDDWLVDLPFWLAASAMLHVVLQRGSKRRIAMSFWRIGLVLQFVFLVCDLLEGKALVAWSLSAGDLASIAGWSRLLAIECYVVALVLVDGTVGTHHVLSAMRRLHDSPYDMKDKVIFAIGCRQRGLPVPQTLLESTANKEGVEWHVCRNELDRDLFCNARSGRNSLGSLVFRRIAKNLYRDPEGDEIDLDTVLAWVDAYSRTTPVIVQPLLRNHPEIADLADVPEGSLVTMRVLTCLDSDDLPVLTHAFLRTDGRLAQKWRRKDSLGVDPATGRVADGRVLQTWPAIRALALDAHRAFPKRIIAGWEIAMTDKGPLLLAGSIGPDEVFPRRHDWNGIGLSPLGPLLQHHISASLESRNPD
ncbi:sugar-transfer associated ATP-grasp domain-containing protein [Variovorax sp. RHLX14]|uniref:sugar-transfer associated ATP-grasp domain-containing protein n=1 Tax=Variovorax sp. RHLX14 TaxID=1259731 RepID=UPI003F477D83